MRITVSEQSNTRYLNIKMVRENYEDTRASEDCLYWDAVYAVQEHLMETSGFSQDDVGSISFEFVQDEQEHGNGIGSIVTGTVYYQERFRK